MLDWDAIIEAVLALDRVAAIEQKLAAMTADADRPIDGRLRLSRVAYQLGVSIDTAERWCRAFTKTGAVPFPGFVAEKIKGFWWIRLPD